MQSKTNVFRESTANNNYIYSSQDGATVLQQLSSLVGSCPKFSISRLKNVTFSAFTFYTTRIVLQTHATQTPSKA